MLQVSSLIVFASVFLSALSCKSTSNQGSSGLSATRAGDITRSSLAPLDKNFPSYKDVDADMAHYYVGLTPREMSLGVKRSFQNPRLPERLKALAELELPKLRSKLGLSSVQFEMWPTQDGFGQVTWQMSRYRSRENAPWQWLDSSHENPKRGHHAKQGTGLIMPFVMDPMDINDRMSLFNRTPAELQTREDKGAGITVGALYEHAAFESVVWTTPEMTKAFGAWEKYGNERKYIDLCTKRPACKAVYLTPPARFDDRPIAFLVRVNESGVTFETPVEWIPENRSRPKVTSLNPLNLAYPSDLRQIYKRYLMELTGETPIKDNAGRVIDFKKQSSALKGNQLLGTMEYLERLHREWGYGSVPHLEIEAQRFDYMGIPQANLIVRIRGQNENLPIVVGSSHYDKAMAEDTFASSKWKRLETNPGADDAMTGMAMMLMAAEVFAERYRDTRPTHTIEIVHFTGEEFPAGTLGSRHYVSQLLKKGIDVKLDVDLDMNGFRNPGDPVYQINPGTLPASWEYAELAYSIAMSHGGPFKPMVRYPHSKESFLNQTDGTIFEWMGYPVILINEHINMVKRDHPHYHQTTDRVNTIDLEYALAQYKVFLETLIRAAE